MAEKTIRDLVVWERLTIGPPQITKDAIKAAYTVRDLQGKESSTELIYSYEEGVFDPDDAQSRNLASVIIAQVGLNYGLFSNQILFDGLFDNSDKKFITDMMENTSREIYVNKILADNIFLTSQAQGIPAQQHKRYTAAKITFTNTSFPEAALNWSHRETDRDRHIILSSGGKDSLLSYGLLKEIGKQADPVFVNESGRHWFTAINAYRYLKQTDPSTARVWTNSDRVFNWMLRQMPFIREDYQKVKADYYPIRLWTVAVFIFGVMPIAFKRKASRMVIGNEYDTTVKTSYQGITHYNSLYDQSRFFDQALSRYYLKKGWSISQFSILRPLSEMLILNILVKRYPELQKEQVSCHASHEKEGRIYPCGSCEKCRRIVGMLSVTEEDPKRCGYTEDQVIRSLKALETKKVKQLGSDASHLFYLLVSKNLIQPGEEIRKMAKPFPRIMQLRYDNERSLLSDVPPDLRAPLIKIYLQYANGAVRLRQHQWQDLEILNSQDMQAPYPFEVMMGKKGNITATGPAKRDYLWATLSWQEIEARLKEVDTAILPCGSIEQHGPHLPVDVDHYDAEYLAIRVAEACSDPKPFVLPGVPYGVSYHHEDFPGTVSITNEGLFRFIYDVGMSLAKNGIRKLVILNGHGDNAPTLNFAAQMINRDANIFVCVDTGETSDEDIGKITESRNDIHAGEVETSTTLAARPWMVNMEKAEGSDINFKSEYLNFGSSRGLPWYARTKKISENGVMGDPAKASREKGEKIWEIMVAHLVSFIEEIKVSRLEDLFQKRY